MMKDNLVSPVPMQAPHGVVKASETSASSGRVQPPVPVTDGKTLPRREAAEVQQRDLSTVVESLNDYAQSVKRDLQFSVEETSGRTVITVKDSETEEIIRQIPSESAVALASYLRSEGRLASFGLIEKA
jgi:flagellar protein FlaG